VNPSEAKKMASKGLGAALALAMFLVFLGVSHAPTINLMLVKING
jgi:hypothetical protein